MLVSLPCIDRLVELCLLILLDSPGEREALLVGSLISLQFKHLIATLTHSG